MDMDLVLIFGFVASLVLILTVGVILFPIARKLGYFLEQAARERAERLATSIPEALPSPPNDQLIEVLTSIQTQVGELAERQTFTESLLEHRAEEPPPSLPTE